MPTESNIYNAIGWAHLQLRGGWKNLLITSTGYAVLLAVIMISTVQLNPEASSSILYGWAIGFIGLQAGVLLIFGCLTTTAAVRLDHTSKMIESHRIMPAPPAMAILGYVIGSPTQGMAMAVANFILGAIAAAGAQISFERWATANLILFTFAIFVWVIVVFFGFMAQTAFRWIVSAFIVVFWMSQGTLLLILPGLTILASPLIGNSVFTMRTSTATLSWEYMVSAAAQLLIGTILFAGAARKYRRADTPALGHDLGMLFLAAWVILSMLGLQYWDHFEPHWLRDNIGGSRTRFIATLLATMLIAIIPAAGAARAEVKYNRRLRLGDTANLPRRPLPPLIIALLAAVISLLLMYVIPYRGIDHAQQRTAIIFISFILSMSFLIRLIEKDGQRVWVLPALWLVITWSFPILADLMYHGLAEIPENTTGIISTLSPVGALFTLWSPGADIKVNPNIGLSIQAALAIVMGAIFYGRRARQTKGQGFEVISPPASPPSATPSSHP